MKDEQLWEQARKMKEEAKLKIKRQVSASNSTGLLSAELPRRPGRIEGIFKQSGLWAKLDFIFWRTLCPMPDQTKLGMWWYGKSAKIAAYFHRKHCRQCKGR